MLYCSCGKPIPEARILAVLEISNQLPDTCIECANKAPKPVGFMVMSGEKGARKVGAELMVVDPRNNPNYREQLRQARRANRRSR